MAKEESSRTPPGRTPWDPANGLRVGAAVGALAGAAATVLLGVGFVWLLPVGAVAGGAIGYATEKRRLRPPD